MKENTSSRAGQPARPVAAVLADLLVSVSASLEQNGSPEHFLVRFAFGRRGSTLQTGTKTATPVDYDTALRTFNQLVAGKMAKGYTSGASGTPYQHTGHEGRSTGIYPQLLEPVADTHALGHLLIDPLYCAQEKFDGKRLPIEVDAKICCHWGEK